MIKTILWLTAFGPVSSFADVSLPGCSGALFRMPGMSNSDKALIITAGHCSQIGSHIIPITGSIVPDRGEYFSYSKTDSIRYHIHKNFVYNYKTYYYEDVVFSTMTTSDIAIIQTEFTYKYLLDNGYRIFKLSTEPPRLGQILRVLNFSIFKETNCKVNGIAPLVLEQQWFFNNMIRVENDGTNCSLLPGSSGSPGVDLDGDIISGIVSTGESGKNPPCSINNPCEPNSNKKGEYLEFNFRPAYLTPVHQLYQCWSSSEKRFNFEIPGCQYSEQKISTKI